MRHHPDTSRPANRHGWIRTACSRLLGRPAVGAPPPRQDPARRSKVAPERLAALREIAERFGGRPGEAAARTVKHLRGTLETVEGQRAGSFALDLIAAGELPEATAAHILAASHARGYSYWCTLDTLRIAARLQDRLPTPSRDEAAYLQAERLLVASSGLAMRDRQLHKGDDLPLTDGTLAVVEFLVRVTEGVPIDGPYRSLIEALPLAGQPRSDAGPDSRREVSLWIADRQFERVICGRRDDMDAIVACARNYDRGLTADALEELLDLGAPAVNVGWL